MISMQKDNVELNKTSIKPTNDNSKSSHHNKSKSVSFNDKICNFCNKKGHIAKHCWHNPNKFNQTNIQHQNFHQQPNFHQKIKDDILTKISIVKPDHRLHHIINVTLHQLHKIINRIISMWTWILIKQQLILIMLVIMIQTLIKFNLLNKNTIQLILTMYWVILEN